MIDPVLIPAVMSLSFQGIIGILSQIQHSKCSEVRGCGCECIREIPKEEPKEEQLKELDEITARPVNYNIN